MAWYEHKELGYNYRLSNVLAAIGVGQMEVLPERIAQKREIFERYRRELEEFGEIEWMPEIPGSRGNRWLTTLTLRRSDPKKIIGALQAQNIESRLLWKPMHLQPLFRGAKVYGGSVSEDLFARGLCLPSGTAMSPEEQKRVSRIVKKAL